ncbi:MAG TPA: cytochrome C [Myxococcota bacterium]|nr:cytochrome C [Myxococcota bacterium]
MSATVLAAALLAAAPAEPSHTPAVDYALHCQGCHLVDGRATPGSVPALSGTVARLARTPGGREYMARVPGVAQAPLGDAELAALLNWVVQRFGPVADFAPYGADEVGRLRAQPLVDVAAARRALLGGDAH